MDCDGKTTVQVGDLSLDFGRGLVTRDGAEIPLPKLTFDLLRALVEAAPNLVTADDLMRRVWPGLVVSPETISQRVRLLRLALDDDSQNPRYVAVVRGRGYRLVAPVETRLAPQPVPVQHPRRRAWLLAGAALAAAALAISLWSWGRLAVESGPDRRESHARVSRPVLAVLPFVALGESPDPWSLPDGLQSDILTELSRSPSLDVIAATSVEQFRGTKLSAADIGRQLGATHLLEGGVQRVGESVRINAQLIETRSQSHVWAATYDRALTTSNLFAVQGEIAVAVAQALRLALGSDGGRKGHVMPTGSMDAWALEKAARIQLERRTPEAITNAQRLFRQAITIDPKFARAYAGLADAVWLGADYQSLPWRPAAAEAERLANHALRIDPELPEAWTTLAKLAQDRNDFATAEAAYRRAFELNPNYARAHAWYAQLLYQQGRQRDAVAATRRAAELDPMSAVLLVNLGLSFADPADPQVALALMDKARAMDPTGWLGVGGKAMAYAIAGRYDDALHWELEVLRLHPAAGHAMIGASQSLLELDDLDGARAWLEHATADGREIPGVFSHHALLHLYRGESIPAVASAHRAVAVDPDDTLAYRVLGADALRRGETADVIATVRANFPDLEDPELLRIRRATVWPATDLALALRLAGDAVRSEALLDAVVAFLDSARRGGAVEYGIDELRVAAIRGDAEAALGKLDELVEGGWRGPYWRYYRDHDPALDGLRADPRFQDAFARIERHMAAQRSRAAASGDLAVGPPEAVATR
jgi:TolB-like protein/DNA-binding winged helix-turn-helix (wHTH) protein/Flp pilus assembly protein TadD